MMCIFNEILTWSFRAWSRRTWWWPFIVIWVCKEMKTGCSFSYTPIFWPYWSVGRIEPEGIQAIIIKRVHLMAIYFRSANLNVHPKIVPCCRFNCCRLRSASTNIAAIANRTRRTGGLGNYHFGPHHPHQTIFIYLHFGFIFLPCASRKYIWSNADERRAQASRYPLPNNRLTHFIQFYLFATRRRPEKSVLYYYIILY